MYKSCARCGKIHSTTFKCESKRIYVANNERKLRSTNKWTEKSKEIRERANNLCEVCRDEGVFTYKNLEVHHITKLMEAPDLLLENNNLICLCVEHHKKADDGLLDKDYLIRLAEKRESTL